MILLAAFLAIAVTGMLLFNVFFSSDNRKGSESSGDSLSLFEGKKIISEYKIYCNEDDFEYVDKREKDYEETIEISLSDEESYGITFTNYSGVHLKPKSLSSNEKEITYVIPVNYKGDRISYIDAINKDNGIKTLFFPDGCVCFSNVSVCNTLEEIYISEDVLFNVTDNITECENLKKIYVSKNNKSACFPRVDVCANLQEVYVQDSLKILNNNFNGCVELKTVVLPEGLEIIKNSFMSLYKLEELNIPGTVRYISNSFIDCPGLTLVVEKGSYAEEYAIEHDIKYEIR